jgi:hypothetical protein
MEKAKDKDIRQFRLQWTLVTLAGYVLAILILLSVANSIRYAVQRPVFIGLVSGALLGGLMGTGQWLLLRRRSPVTPAWIGVSIAGGMIGMAFGMALDAFAAPVSALRDPTQTAASLIIPWHFAWQTSIAGLLFGLGLGLAQWWGLREFVRSASWWITTNAAAWMAGFGAGAALAGLITTLGALLLTGVVAAIITAYVMERWQWEMHKRTKPIPGRQSF